MPHPSSLHGSWDSEGLPGIPHNLGGPSDPRGATPVTPWASIPAPANCPVLAIGAGAKPFAMAADGTPLVLAVNVPADPWYYALVFKQTRYTVSTKTPFMSQTGIYGPPESGPPLVSLSGSSGLIAGPGVGQWGLSYVMTRVLSRGQKNFIVVRPQVTSPGALVSVGIVAA